MAGSALAVVNAARSGWLDVLVPRPSLAVRPLAAVASTQDAEPVPQQPAPKSSPQVLVIDEPGQHVADYGTSAAEGAWVHGPEESLGYRYL